ncbi:ScbA/BarX family gamma-butyrolactone biosynthesis protein [Amycolatopsis anabasis]|uniref:ScbA/BarX family gamma-butyrolactone biosynthesis protein n=1 Tax=Amycolatopsis anabasis TaxID=1840409 RepID=UPI00131B30B7|nr:ScbA/BarX family gamma-butyrolactone biosynthesis protein [Amycolatopsis anabasis]
MAPDIPVSWRQALPSDWVHKRAVSEVLLTDWRALPEGNVFECAAQWPRSHSFYRVHEGEHDPLMLAETMRQIGILLCHRAYTIPVGWSFLMGRMRFTIPTGLAAETTPANVVVRVTVIPHDPTPRRTRFAMEMEFFRDGSRIAHGAGSVSCVEPALYARMRGSTQPPGGPPADNPAPLEPSRVGRFDPLDVVIGAAYEPGVWPVRLEFAHPVLFDHPLDHVPGMLLLEAWRQAARDLLGWPGAQPSACDVSFDRFLELSRSSLVRLEIDNESRTEARLNVQAVQDREVAAEGTMTLRRSRGGG